MISIGTVRTDALHICTPAEAEPDSESKSTATCYGHRTGLYQRTLVCEPARRICLGWPSTGLLQLSILGKARFGFFPLGPDPLSRRTALPRFEMQGLDA